MTGGAAAKLGVRLGALAVALTALWPASGKALQLLTLGGAGPATLVLLHGYGSSAGEWQPFAATIPPRPGWRLIFPEGTTAVARRDGGVGRGWWKLDLERYLEADGLPDLSAARPPGLVAAAAAARRLVSTVVGHPMVLGGFSQGAMVAGEVAFTSAQPLAALVLLSVSPIDEASWRRGFATRKGLPVFIAHGRADDCLSFAAADRLRGEMTDAGLAVTWVPFDGGHEIAPTVVTALKGFLAALR